MMLVTWMEVQKEKKNVINSTIICAKALKLYKHLRQEDGSSSAAESFLASKGWFENFKKHQNLYNMKLKMKVLNVYTFAPQTPQLK